MENTKPFNINKELVKEAYKKVKANKGAAGVDEQSLQEFEINLEDNLYKLWNRMSSGSYFPPPVKAVEISKRNGGKRTLGIPTVTDRIAQAVVKIMIQPKVEKYFYKDSYGYRPKKHALEGVKNTRERCWKYKWLVEYDIKGMFDNINHEKLMKVVNGHVKEKWQVMYIERWINAPIQFKGKIVERTKGTPQGGVISPLLCNLFMHYAFDEWMKRNHPKMQWARYADDGIIHCKTKEEAEKILEQIKKRFEECDLEIHPEKSKIVYCGNEEGYPNKSFTFLGYTFQPRRAKAQNGKVFTGYLPAISQSKMKEIRQEIRSDNIRARTDLDIKKIAEWYNPKLQGWYNYSGKFYSSKFNSIWRYFNKVLVLWARSKYKKIRTSKMRAVEFIKRIQQENQNLFFHWKLTNGKGIYV